LEKAGLEINRLQTDMVPPELVELFRLAAYEPVWLVHPAGAPAPVTAATIEANLATALPIVMRRMAAHAELLRVELEEQKAAAERWRRTYRQLRTQLPVRVLLRANRVRRQLVTRARGRSGATGA
jgi:hypothetical protein